MLVETFGKSVKERINTRKHALSFIEFLFKSFCFPSKGNILENRKKIILQQKLFNCFFYNLIENEIKNSSLQMRFNIVLRIVDGQIFLFLNHKIWNSYTFIK